MEEKKNIPEKSAEVKGFSTKPWISKEEPEMRIRDWYDLPCLKSARERLFREKEFLRDLLSRHLRESKNF